MYLDLLQSSASSQSPFGDTACNKDVQDITPRDALLHKEYGVVVGLVNTIKHVTKHVKRSNNKKAWYNKEFFLLVCICSTSVLQLFTFAISQFSRFCSTASVQTVTYFNLDEVQADVRND